MKKYAYVAIGLLVTVLGIAVRILSSRNSKLQHKVERAEARIHHGKVVAETQIKTEKYRKSRKAEIAKEIEEKKSSSELSEPNENW